MNLTRLALKTRGAIVAPIRRAYVRSGAASGLSQQWADPHGAHHVGVMDAWISGLGTHPCDGAIRIWYPAVDGTGHGRRAYFGASAEQEAMVRGLSGLLSAEGVDALGIRPTASNCGATPMPTGRGVVLFSHGFTGFVGQNTHLCEHLAAAGYVVISVAYPGGAAAIAAADGSARVMTRAERDRLVSDEFVRVIQALLRSRSIEEEDVALGRATQVRSLAEENARWTQHLRAVLDALISDSQRRNRVQPAALRVLDAADWSRIALVGMSFGGSTSANVAHVDPRVRAAVNLDGMQQGALLLGHDIRVPLLVMSSDGSLLPSGRTINDLHYQAPSSGADVQRVRVPTAKHYAFTDLVELEDPRVRRWLDIGTVGSVRMLGLVAKTTLDFLDQSLAIRRPTTNSARGQEQR